VAKLKKSSGIQKGDFDSIKGQVVNLDVDPKILKVNPKNPFTPLEPKLFDKLVESVAAEGVLVPIIAKADNTIIDGHNRVKAAIKARRKVPVHYVEGSLTVSEVDRLTLRLQLLRRNLTAADHAGFLIKIYPDLVDTVSTQPIAEDTGLSLKQIQRAKHVLATAKGTAKADLVKAQAKINEARRKKAKTIFSNYLGETESHLKAIESLYRQQGKTQKTKIKDALKDQLDKFKRIDKTNV